MTKIWEKTMLNEGARNNSLRNLIDALVSIDQFKSKTGDDKNVIVVAIKINKKDPAHELSQFLESGLTDAIDVDISPGPDHNGKYTVFVELERNSRAFEMCERIINDIRVVDNTIETVSFTSYENKQPQEWSKEAFESSVITSSYDYVIKHDPDAREIDSRIKFLNKY